MFKGKKHKIEEPKIKVKTWREAMINFGDEEFKEYYEANKGNINGLNDGYNGPLPLACERNRFELVKFLLEDENINPQERRQGTDSILGRILWRASSNSESAKILEYLLEHPRVDVNVRNGANRTPFQIACTLNNKSILELFIKNPRVDLSVSDNGQSPMFEACAYGSIQTFEALIECDKIDVDLPEPGTNATPLYIACEKGHLEPAKILIKHPKVNGNAMNKFSSTPLYVACQNGMTEIVKVLLEDEKVDISLSRANGMTPFMISCFYGHNSIVQLFLSSGKDLQINKIVDGKTALDLAKERSHTETVELLQTYLNS